MKIIVTGATGMVGEGVILACLENPKVEKILMVNRKHFSFHHPKLEEYILPDFINSSYSIDIFKEYDACFFCAGISSVGMTEAAFTHATYDTTISFAQKMKAANPQMVFNYVSGAMTDSTENGKVMWARVKGKTENDLIKMGFKNAFMFRPGFIKPFKGQKNIRPLFKVITFLIPLLMFLFPSGGGTVEDIAKAMVNVSENGFDTNILEVPDIKRAAQ
jgi:uncharacterized protein YbjT (DUF2867 family)